MDEAYLQWLSLIPEVGRERARKIAERFPDFERLRAAYFAELTAIPGVDDKVARRILEVVRGRGSEDQPREAPSLYSCPECGAFVGKGATACELCGAEFIGEARGPALPGVASPIESIVLGEHGPVPLCGECGALDRKSTRLNSSHIQKSRMPSSA